jgi:uncharacterized SAM-binding protein YcdF (DUF218 family)
MSWLAIGLVYALITRNPKRRRNALWAIAALFFFFSNHFICNQVFKWWEPDIETSKVLTTPYEVGILLGGYSNPYIIPGNDRYNLSERGNRLVNTLELYHKGKIKKILLTGGSGSLYSPNYVESDEVLVFLKTMGVPDTNIIVEGRSRNTWENAKFTKMLLEKQYGKSLPRCLLITSAWHMPRSAACFKRAGLTVEIYPVDYITECDRWAPDYWLLPEKLGFYRWELLIKEWIGCLAYKLKGYN